MKTRLYILRPGSGNPIRALAHRIEDYLTWEEGMNCILMRTEDGAYIVQGKSRHEAIARWAGLGRGLSVRLTPLPPDRVRVDLLPDRATEKRVLLALGLLFFLGLSLACVCGMFRQALLTRRVDRLISGRLCR